MPTITAVSPADTGTLAKQDFIIVDITDADMVYHVVAVRFPEYGVTEVAYHAGSVALSTPYEVYRHAIANGYRYRIRRRGGWLAGMGPPEVYATSADNLSVTLTAPNGGGSYIAGDSISVTWTSVGTFSSFDLEYSTNNGSSWTSIATGVTSPYAWTAPSTVSSQYLVRVTGNGATTVTDTSDATFSVALQSAWTGSSFMEANAACISALYSDDAVDSGSSPYTLTSLPDTDTTYGVSAWSSPSGLKRANWPNPQLTYNTGYATRSVNDVLGLHTLLNGGAGTNPEGGGSTYVLTYFFYAKTITYGFNGPSSRRHYVSIDATNVTWYYGTASSITLAHGLDTSSFRHWTVYCDGSSSGSSHIMTVYADNVLVGSDSGSNFSSSGGPWTMFAASGNWLAAGCFANSLSSTNRANFQS